jgi:hypothetical protein
MLHVIIQTERRKAPRELAQEMVTHTRNAQGQITSTKTQLHTMGERITDPTNVVYAAEWDGKAPYVTVLKGSVADINMAYAGWPMIDEEAWKLANP